MTEDFLHFIWRTQNFDFRNLQTTDGQSVEILNFGQWNTGAGPDFGFARIRLGGTEWAGTIEMHLCASDWDKHGHSSDPAYENVILHVVLEDDGPVFVKGRKVPCIELKNRVNGALLAQYLRLMSSGSWIPCAAHLPTINPVVLVSWLDRMLVSRIESRLTGIQRHLEDTHGNWEEAFFRCLASSYGFKVNSEPFLRLSRILPLTILYKHCASSFQIEALLFGCAGMLNKVFIDDYPTMLQREYLHLAAKYGLTAIDARAWKWGRLRPANFPSIRIAQFAAVVQHFQGLFRLVVEIQEIDVLNRIFQVPVHSYWNTHVDFDHRSRKAQRRLGRASIDGILINTVIPFLFYYGKRRGEEGLVKRALALMESLPPEQNSVTRMWASLGVPNHHAGQSQALLQLKHIYCDQRQCVACAIGNQILSLNETR